MRQPIALHHLPRWSQNLLYISALALSPLVNFCVKTTLSKHLDTLPSCSCGVHANEHWIFSLALFIIGGILVFLSINLVRTLVFKHQNIRKSLLILGIYISLNLTFFFWYWFVDYPTQVRHVNHQDHLCAIVFPRESLIADPRWLPRAIDYLYFTVMTSNTLGPPENHSPVAANVKFLQLLQSSIMLVLLVLIVSRDVNTLG
jgi:hypothetical protein